MNAPKKTSENWELFKLHYNMKKHLKINSFQQLQCTKHLPHIKPLPHQVNTVKKVVFKMNGRAILADEVGLGKTIEAGLIMKEYLLRGLVKSILILVPASLVEQWVKELQTKFQLPVMIYQKNYTNIENKIVVASLSTAKKQSHHQLFKQTAFDLVIVDEAHQLKNKRTINYQFIQQLNKKYCLLLTATPIQNHLNELITLLTIIHPTIQICQKKMRDSHETTLQFEAIVKQSIIRHRREDIMDHHSKRRIKKKVIAFSAEEQAIYDSLKKQVKHHPADVIQQHYLKAFCSSREACYLSLQNATDTFKKKTDDIQENISKLPHHSKALQLIDILKKYQGKKVLIFTQYYATLYYLYYFLQQNHIPAVTISGKLKHRQKTWVTTLFSGDVDVLIATEAAQEGVNMQFCHVMINYDLPWNPLKIEQRIGRIDRIGQKEEVIIYHLLMQHTIEETMLDTLYGKINIFEKNIGQLNHILTNEQVSDKDGS